MTTARPDDASVFNWQAPDYAAVLVAREARLKRLRDDPELLAATVQHYRHDPGGYADFLNDWACAPDPRNVGAGRMALVPFLVMPRQRDMIEFILARWRAGEPGLIEKSRDCGASQIIMMLSCSLCLFNRDLVIGVGSAKEDLADRSGDPSSLLHKARSFLSHLPVEFRGSWTPRNSAHMRIAFPATGSSIVAEAGDNIGRGGRSSLFFLDEAAHVERPKLVDAALSANTDVRIDVSSVSGMANSFAQRRHSGRVKVFTFHYRDDLRKGPEWAARKKAETDSVTWAAEFELDYLASVEGVLIKAEWVRAAVDAHKKLGIEPTGIKAGALDAADLGQDMNCFAARHGNLVTFLSTWSGQGSDLHDTTEKVFELCDSLGLSGGFQFDAASLGAGVRAAANKIRERRMANGQATVKVFPFLSSGAVFAPESKAKGCDVKNKDRFQNLKAQRFVALRDRFENTFRLVNGAKDADPDNTIFISGDIAPDELNALCVELSTPTCRTSATGKLMVDKYGEDNAASPNRADAVMMLMGDPYKPPLRIDEALLSPYAGHLPSLGGPESDFRMQPPDPNWGR